MIRNNPTAPPSATERARGRKERGITRGSIRLLAPALAALQTSCVVVGGYSDEGGWYLWPGSLLLTALFLLLFMFLRRRRR